MRIVVAGPQHESYIYRTWLESFKRSKRAPKVNYYNVQRARINAVMRMPSTRVYVGVNDDDGPDWVYGFIVGNGVTGEVDYVYVRNHWRNEGRGKALLAALRDTKQLEVG